MGDASLSIEFKVLGPLEVVCNGRVVPLGGARQRLVLAALIASANAVVSADRLIDIVWGDEPPESALSTLQKSVYRLRGHVEARFPKKYCGSLVQHRDQADLGTREASIEALQVGEAFVGLAPQHNSVVTLSAMNGSMRAAAHSAARREEANDPWTSLISAIANSTAGVQPVTDPCRLQCAQGSLGGHGRIGRVAAERTARARSRSASAEKTASSTPGPVTMIATPSHTAGHGPPRARETIDLTCWCPAVVSAQGRQADVQAAATRTTGWPSRRWSG
jgi:hypothetical protein